MKTLEKRMISYLFILLIINYTVSCSYYKVIVSPASEVSRFPSAEIINSEFIVHQDDNLYILKIKSLDQKSIIGRLQTINKDSIFYDEDSKNKKYRHSPKSKREPSILDEVHIYLYEGVETIHDGQTEILIDQIKEIRFIEKDDRKTKNSFLWGLAGVITVVLALLILYPMSSKDMKFIP